VVQADADAAHADRIASLAGVLPRLDVQSSIGRSFTGASTLGLINPITQEIIPPSGASDVASYALGLQLRRPVFDWRTFRDVSRATSSARAVERQVDEARLTLAFEVTRRFYDVVRAERSLAVLEKTAARSEDLVGRAEALFAAVLSREYQSSAQLVVSWNLFEGRRTSAEVQRAESSARRARAAEGQVVATVTRELADARTIAGSTARQVGLAAENLRTADEGLALARERLDAELTQLELRDDSLKLTQAELSLVEARIDHQVALADLARAAGGAL
jgi:outer membrane protein TolC